MNHFENKSKQMIIGIHFNNLKYTDARLTSQWINERLDVFWKYTLQSFKVQTNQNFEVYLHYDIESEDVIQTALQRRERLPDNVHCGDVKSYKEAIVNKVSKSDLFYFIRLDSDNLYHKDYIQKLHDYKPKKETEALMSQYGYLYGEQSGRLAYYYQLSPPFYTLLYKSKEYIRGKRYELPGGHGSVSQRLKCEFLSGNNYLVTLHGHNVSNGEWLMQGKSFVKEKKEKILQEFGIKY